MSHTAFIVKKLEDKIDENLNKITCLFEQLQEELKTHQTNQSGITVKCKNCEKHLKVETGELANQGSLLVRPCNCNLLINGDWSYDDLREALEGFIYCVCRDCDLYPSNCNRTNCRYNYVLKYIFDTPIDTDDTIPF